MISSAALHALLAARLHHVVPAPAGRVGEHLGLAGEEGGEEAHVVGVVGDDEEVERARRASPARRRTRSAPRRARSDRRPRSRAGCRRRRHPSRRWCAGACRPRRRAWGNSGPHRANSRAACRPAPSSPGRAVPMSVIVVCASAIEAQATIVIPASSGTSWQPHFGSSPMNLDSAARRSPAGTSRDEPRRDPPSTLFQRYRPRREQRNSNIRHSEDFGDGIATEMQSLGETRSAQLSCRA